MKAVTKKFIQMWLTSTFAVLVTVTILRKHFHCDPSWVVFIVSLLIGILNVYLRPLLLVLALPLVIFSLGFFLVVINGCIIYIVDWMMGKSFEVDGFGWAMVGSVFIGIISFILNVITGNVSSPVKVIRSGRQTSQQNNQDNNDDGPVIDV